MPRGRTKNATSNWSNPKLIREMLEEARVIAIVGISDNPSRPSYHVARYLIENGYHVVGVNPTLEDVLGTLCYPSLESVPEPVDVVNVFRKSEAVDEIVTDVIRMQIPYLWLQQGVVNFEAAERAKESGIKVIMDHCIMSEHSRLSF